MTMAMVEYETVEHVVRVTLNRPQKRNAINGDMARAIEAAIDRVEADDHIRVAILRATSGGDRPVFCAGHDLAAAADGEDGSVTERGGFAGIVRRPRTKPLVAAVDGLATAGGLEILLACDVVVASDRASFGLAETRWNLVPGGGGLFRLTRIVGRPVAMDLLLTGQPMSAERAYQLGLVSRLTSAGTLDETALEVARTIAEHGPAAIRLCREIGTLAEFIDDDTAWHLSEQAYAEVSASEDTREGLRAFSERRPPRFTGR
jgi:enoyl-CoA hydratase